MKIYIIKAVWFFLILVFLVVLSYVAGAVLWPAAGPHVLGELIGIPVFILTLLVFTELRDMGKLPFLEKHYGKKTSNIMRLVRIIGALAVILYFFVAAEVRLTQAATNTGKPVTLDDINAGRIIERALMMSELMTLGTLQTLEAKLPNSPEKPKKIACVNSRLSEPASEIFGREWAMSLTAKQLEEGARLASAPVLSKARVYTLANLDRLGTEAKSSGEKVDHYYLVSAAKSLPLPTDDKAKLDAFILWHQNAEKAPRAMSEDTITELMTATKTALQECKVN